MAEEGSQKLYKVIDEILWKDWNPIGVNDIPSARDEYQTIPAKYRRSK